MSALGRQMSGLAPPVLAAPRRQQRKRLTRSERHANRILSHLSRAKSPAVKRQEAHALTLSYEPSASELVALDDLAASVAQREAHCSDCLDEMVSTIEQVDAVAAQLVEHVLVENEASAALSSVIDEVIRDVTTEQEAMVVLGGVVSGVEVDVGVTVEQMVAAALDEAILLLELMRDVSTAVEQGLECVVDEESLDRTIHESTAALLDDMVAVSAGVHGLVALVIAEVAHEAAHESHESHGIAALGWTAHPPTKLWLGPTHLRADQDNNKQPSVRCKDKSSSW